MKCYLLLSRLSWSDIRAWLVVLESQECGEQNSVTTIQFLVYWPKDKSTTTTARVNTDTNFTSTTASLVTTTSRIITSTFTITITAIIINSITITIMTITNMIICVTRREHFHFDIYHMIVVTSSVQGT